jgi:hypothetical protein
LNFDQETYGGKQFGTTSIKQIFPQTQSIDKTHQNSIRSTLAYPGLSKAFALDPMYICRNYELPSFGMGDDTLVRNVGFSLV